MTSEIWRTIEGFPDYEVSNLGRVRSYKTFTVGKEPTVLKGQINKRFGYYQVILCNRKEGKNRNKRINRLVAEAFIPNPDNKPEVNHINGIKTDNQVENLEWCNHSENALHYYKMSKKTKLTEEQVREIRSSDQSCSILGKKYGVSKRHIWEIKKNIRYSWM